MPRRPALGPALLLAVAAAAGATPAVAAVDRDGNGLSDLWELIHGTGHVAQADLDGDGFTAAQEDAAGTDPTSAASRPVLAEVSFPSADVLRASWDTVVGKRYQLEVTFDYVTWFPMGAPVTGSGQRVTRDIPTASPFSRGAALWSRWSVPGWNGGLGTVAGLASAGTPPAGSGELTTLEIPQTVPDLEFFGTWVRGWIVPPATGSYTFWVASDDASELRLSPNATAASAVRIARVDQWTDFRQWTKYGIQQSAPVQLEANRPVYFEAFQREYGGGDHLSIAWTGPGLASPREMLSGAHVARSPLTIAEARAAAGGGLAVRLAVMDQDLDGDGVTDHEEAIAGLNPAWATTVPRVADMTTFLERLDAPSVVTLGTPEPRAYEETGSPAFFTVFRSGGLGPLTVRYVVSGDALSGVDFPILPGVIEVPAGATSVSFPVLPIADGVQEPAEGVTVDLLPGAGYELGTPFRSMVTIDDAADVIHVASLRSAAGEPPGGWGSVRLRVAGNGQFADASVSFGNLSSPQVATEFFVSSTGTGGPTVLTLPAGQVPFQRWSLEPAGGLSSDQIRAALEEGRLWARIATAGQADGEVVGRFQTAPAFQQMPAVPPPPAVSGGAPTPGDAARFLNQATFGARLEEIPSVQSLGYAAWVNQQLLQPATFHLPSVQARRAQLLERSDGEDDGWQSPRQEAWWQAAITAPDQLRQRMAFALSEIFVISDIGVLDIQHEGVTTYYDLLVQHAFGNYRDLLEAVTLSPAMGQYLSMMRNRKPDLTTGAEPDENYSREIMQLFSIGLNRMHADGSLELDETGMPIPTYTQADIVGLAHIFTGWGPHYDGANPPRWPDGNVASRRDWFLYGWDEKRPMSFVDEFHDHVDRTIVGGVVVPGALTGQERMRQALDAIFNHPNVPPFMARQLIQRFVTSNPGPGYVHRVAQVFANDGTGVRGNLGATLRAVLLDPEARTTETLGSVGWGKLREPLLRLTHLLRAHAAWLPVDGDSRYFIDLQYGLSHQAALKSPSVFNFFQPGFVQPGVIARAGLLSPEFQITSETTVVRQINEHHAGLFWGFWTRESSNTSTYRPVWLNLSREVEILNGPYANAAAAQAALLDHLSLIYLNGRMSPELREAILDAFAALPGDFGTGYDSQDRRVRVALYLILSSPEYAVLR